MRTRRLGLTTQRVTILPSAFFLWSDKTSECLGETGSSVCCIHKRTTWSTHWLEREHSSEWSHREQVVFVIIKCRSDSTFLSVKWYFIPIWCVYPNIPNIRNVDEVSWRETISHDEWKETLFTCHDCPSCFVRTAPDCVHLCNYTRTDRCSYIGKKYSARKNDTLKETGATVSPSCCLESSCCSEAIKNSFFAWWQAEIAAMRTQTK